MTEYTQGTQVLTNRQILGIGMSPVKQSFLEWVAVEDAKRQELYNMYRDYYAGDQDVMITDRQKAFLELDGNQDFVINYCKLIANQIPRRLTVQTFDGPDGVGGKDGILWKWWRYGRMDSKQKDVYTAAVRDGDTYVIVSWDNERGRPVFTHNLAFDGMEGVKVHYSDETGHIAMASKRWPVKIGQEDDNSGVGERRRLNLYYPNRIERYISDDRVAAGAWRPYDDDGEPAVIPWVNKRTGRPLGVPVFHLKYLSGGYRFGTSILADIIPLQNALNKSFVDVIAAADTTAFRVYWATGTDMLDEDGEPLAFHPGTFLSTNNPDATFGYMQGESLRSLIEVVDMVKVTMAQIAEIPLHLFQVSGQNASEGAQKQQEVAMISKTEDWGVTVGNFWEDCLQMGIRMSNAFNKTSLGEDELIDTVWGDMEVRDKSERRRDAAETAAKWTEAGADIEQAAIEAGVPEHRARAIASTATPIADLGGGGGFFEDA